MKANKDMSAQEFAYSKLLKRLVTDSMVLEDHIENLKGVATAEQMDDVYVINAALITMQARAKWALKTL